MTKRELIEQIGYETYPNAANPKSTIAQLQNQLESIMRHKLRKLCKPGTTVYTVLRHVSSSGMCRHIDLYVLRKGEPFFLTGYVGKLLGYKRAKDQGLVVSGCGMDMGFHLVNSLGYALFGEEAGKATGKTANKLREQLLAADTFYYTQGGSKPPSTSEPSPQWHGGAGYALKHKWL